MKYLLLIGFIAGVMYGSKNLNDKLMCLDPEDFKNWLNFKRNFDPMIDKKYQDYLLYAEKMKTTGWKVIPFILYYEGANK
jgi:hypothetical protein